MTTIALAILLLGWLMLYSGIKNQSIGEQFRFLFGK